MAFYQTETRIEGMDIEWVGFDPEKQEAYITLRRTIKVAESMETVWVDHKLTLPLELLKAMSHEVELLAEEMAENSQTEFDLRKPLYPVQ